MTPKERKTKNNTQTIKNNEMIKEMKAHLIRSSCVPFVKTTSPQRRSLKAIPLRVPPQAAKSQSETILGTPSPRTSWINPFLLRGTPAEPADFLNASPIRFNSLSDTVNCNGINNPHTVTLTSLYFRIPWCIHFITTHRAWQLLHTWWNWALNL